MPVNAKHPFDLLAQYGVDITLRHIGPLHTRAGSTGQRLLTIPREDAGTNRALHVPVGAHEKIRRQNQWRLNSAEQVGKDKEPLPKSGL